MSANISASLRELKLTGPHLRRCLRSRHCWTIGLFIAVITAFYYLWYPAVKSSMPAFWFIVFEIKNNVQGSLYFIPFAYAAAVFRVRGAIITYLIAFFAVLPHIIYLSLSGTAIVVNVLYSMIPLLIIILITVERNWRESTKKAMIAREVERQIYMSQIFKAQEDERQRIAAELHDDITQMLMVVAHDIRNIASDQQISADLKTEIDNVRGEIIDISNNVRRLSLDMRPSILDDIGLVPAIEWLANRLTTASNINCKIEVTGNEHRLKQDDELNLFRIVQEALSNIRRHSGADDVLITVLFDSDTLKITIKDNGKGFLSGLYTEGLAAKGKLGLIGMKQRAEFIGGMLDISSYPEHGTTVSLIKPY